MTTAVQVQFRRGTQSQMAAFTGAAGEMNVDTTNNRVVVQDGTTAGGWPAARLSEIGGGFLNKFRNGTMDVWQRGTAPALSAGTSGAQYTADGWIVGWTASASAAPAVAQAGGRLLTKNSLQITGAANLTDVYVKQRIESLVAASLCSQTVTVQARIYNNTGASVTPTLTVNRPSAQDNYASVTADVNAVALQACANGAWTQIAYTFAANAACYNGLEIVVDFGNNFNSSGKSLQIAECDIRPTPGLPSAQQAPSNFIPPPELWPICVELPANQRYLYVVTTQGLSLAMMGEVGMAESTTGFLAACRLPQTMWKIPSLGISAPGDFCATMSTGGTGGAFTGASLGSATTTDRAFIVFSGGSGYVAGNAGFLLNATSNAKLTFSAEL